jgi:transposase
MYYVGLDVHWRTSTYCILDEHGCLVKTQTVRGGWDRLVEALGRIDRPMVIGYEASCGYGVLYERLMGLAHVRSVTVAHAGKLRLIFRSKRKNDRVDAKKLALLLMLGQLPAVWVPSVDIRSWRKAIEYRQTLVNRRTRLKNGLRSLLRGCGVVMPRGLWTRRGLAWLSEVRLPTGLADVQRLQMLEDMARLDGHIKRVEMALDQISNGQPGILLLRTIPGVGPRTAEAVVAYIDQPDRFGRSKAIGSYFGLAPSQDASGSVNRLGHITREGPPTVRRLITEATWQAIRLDDRVRDYHQRLVRGREDRKKIALVGTAHYLLRCMLAMLKSGECWRTAA